MASIEPNVQEVATTSARAGPRPPSKRKRTTAVQEQTSQEIVASDQVGINFVNQVFFKNQFQEKEENKV